SRPCFCRAREDLPDGGLSALDGIAGASHGQAPSIRPGMSTWTGSPSRSSAAGRGQPPRGRVTRPCDDASRSGNLPEDLETDPHGNEVPHRLTNQLERCAASSSSTPRLVADVDDRHPVAAFERANEALGFDEDPA